MEALIKVLEKSVSSAQSDQNDASLYIQNCISTDCPGFFITLCDILANQDNPPVVRAAAGLQLKNQFTSRDEALRNEQQQRWKSLSDSERNYIKSKIVETLGTEASTPSSAPQCVAFIALVELPENKWPDFISKLTNNIINPSASSVQLASLETIGYICQDIDQSCLSIDDCNKILEALVHAINGNNKNAATTALSKFCETKILTIAQNHQMITYEKLGQYLSLEPQYAEMIVAQMIRGEKIRGTLDQIEKVVYFDSKEINQKFDEQILNLCSEVDKIIEKIHRVTDDRWWL